MQGSASRIVGAIVRDNDRLAQLAAADDDLTVRRAALSLLFAGHSDFAKSRYEFWKSMLASSHAVFFMFAPAGLLSDIPQMGQRSDASYGERIQEARQVLDHRHVDQT